MAPVAAPTRTRDDRTPTTTRDDRTPTTTFDGRPIATTHEDGALDELLVRPVEADAEPVALPRLPDGWRHAALVERIARQPRERRETILAGGFALVAALWAPLGVLAFLTRSTASFLAVSAAAVLLALSPRPVGTSEVIGGVTDRAASAVGRIRAVAGSLPERLAPLAARLRDLGRRVATRLRDLGRRGAARLRSVDAGISTAVRSGLESLRGEDHSTPSSTR